MTEKWNIVSGFYFFLCFIVVLWSYCISLSDHFSFHAEKIPFKIWYPNSVSVGLSIDYLLFKSRRFEVFSRRYFFDMWSTDWTGHFGHRPHCFLRGEIFVVIIIVIIDIITTIFRIITSIFLRWLKFNLIWAYPKTMQKVLTAPLCELKGCNVGFYFRYPDTADTTS